MSNFPLYDNLSIDIHQRDLTCKQKTELIQKIKDINSTGAELMYALIRVYQIENTDDQSTFQLPFGGKYVGTDMKFNLELFPNKLKQLLYKFIIIHTQTVEEDCDIQKNRDNVTAPV